MQFLVLGMAALVVGLLLIEVMRGNQSVRWVRTARVAIGILFLALAVGLFVRGLAAPASVLAALGFWLVSATGRGPLGFPGGSKTPGQLSAIRTAYLNVALDHDTGALSGHVTNGPFEGRAIDGLTAVELMELLQVCIANDPPSAQVIETILDQQHPDWRNWQGAEGESGQSHGGGTAAHDGHPMSREHAYQILGLEPGASSAEIRAAHRDLMQKVHPDHGGSTVLAAQINQAKDILLG